MAGEELTSERELQLFRERLRLLPCISTGDLFAFMSLQTSPRQVKQVQVRSILGSEDPPTWDLTDRGSRYVFDLAQKIKSGAIDLNRMEPPALYEYRGLYGVMADGRHTIAAVKGLDNANGQIRAEVGRMVLPVTEIHTLTRQDMAELEHRKQNGLWQGSLTGRETDSIPTGFYAGGKVDKCAGPWVFAKDMEQAKKMYDLVTPPTL